jgi:hydroxylaminobenzene mutase
MRDMNSSNFLEHQGRGLQRVAVGLLLFTSFWGFAFPQLASPHLGQSVHTLCSLLASLLLGLGLTWRSLVLSAATSRLAYWLLLYSGLAIVAAFMLGAIWGAGNETMPLAAGSAHGNAFQEAVIKVVAYSSAPTGIVSFALVLWGLRGAAEGTALGEK